MFAGAELDDLLNCDPSSYNSNFGKLKVDGLVKSRHTRESGYPEAVQLLEKTGFPFSRE
ncbi:MAG TPA: hypothetical protein ACFYEH_01610 [Candidatus Brocadiaceae bacterium]